MREQLLARGCRPLDGVIVTHDHADHCHGIDDLRPLAQIRGRPVPLYARADVLEGSASASATSSRARGFYRCGRRAAVDLATNSPSARRDPLRRPAARRDHLARPADRRGGRSAVYAIDFHELTDDMRASMQGVDVWICDCLRRRRTRRTRISTPSSAGRGK